MNHTPPELTASNEDLNERYRSAANESRQRLRSHRDEWFCHRDRDVEIAHEESADARQAALLVVAMVVVAMALRPGISSIGPVLPLIRREFSLSHAMASSLTTIPTLLMGLLALPTPWLARRFGRNGVMLASLVLLFVSMVARAFAPNVSVLLLTTAGVGGGIAMSGTLFAGIIKARVPRKVATMISIYAPALAFSSTVSAAATG